MHIETFELERNQSLYENTVEFNLTESGIHPYTLRELLSEEQQAEVLDSKSQYEDRGCTGACLPGGADARSSDASMPCGCSEDS